MASSVERNAMATDIHFQKVGEPNVMKRFAQGFEVTREIEG